MTKYKTNGYKLPAQSTDPAHGGSLLLDFLYNTFRVVVGINMLCVIGVMLLIGLQSPFIAPGSNGRILVIAVMFVAAAALALITVVYVMLMRERINSRG